jgi:predicted amino acid dehydrogenase
MRLQASGVRVLTATSTMQRPAAIDSGGANRFAFILHPLTIDYLAHHPRYRWTRHLPPALLESVAAHMAASRVGRVEGGVSPATGQSVTGLIYALGATPRQMLSRPPEFTYRRLDRAVRDAAAQGAQIVGLGAFTKVVGDAGVTVARRASIPVTTGNSLTIAATLETAKLTALRMGWADLAHAKAMIVGATGSIGSVCSRLLAAAVRDVVLVSIEPDRLTALRDKILADTPDANVELDTTTARHVGECDLIVTATSAFGQRVLDVSQCKPGAVILDVALPPDISAEEAATRPDVLVVESGEVLIPGPVDFSFNIGLPPGVAYACLAEAALLAMEGRFESFTLGRDVLPDKVKEIYRLFRKHGFQIAPLRSFGEPLTDALVAAKNGRADELRRDPALLQRVKAEAGAQIARIPPRAKGVTAASTPKP